MILFFGTRTRVRVLGTGSFPCPYCLAPRTYQRLATRTWFHLFWIPIVPLGQAQEEVHCTVCGGQWEPALVDSSQLR